MVSIRTALTIGAWLICYSCAAWCIMKGDNMGLTRNPEKEWAAYRRRKLPEQLERARLRVIHLEREATRIGMVHLLASDLQDEKRCANDQ